MSVPFLALVPTITHSQKLTKSENPLYVFRRENIESTGFANIKRLEYDPQQFIDWFKSVQIKQKAYEECLIALDLVNNSKLGLNAAIEKCPTTFFYYGEIPDVHFYDSQGNIATKGTKLFPDSQIQALRENFPKLIGVKTSLDYLQTNNVFIPRATVTFFFRENSNIEKDLFMYSYKELSD